MAIPSILRKAYTARTASFTRFPTVSVDLGTGAGRTVLAFVSLDASDASVNIAACTAGGVAMTPGAVIPFFGSSNHAARMFWLAGDTVPTGTQNVVGDVTFTDRKPGIIVVVLQDSDGGTPVVSGEVTRVANALANTMTVTSTAASRVVAISIHDADVAGTPDSPSTVYGTVDGAANFWNPVWHRPGAAGASPISCTFTGATPTFHGAAVSVAGSAAAPVLTSPTGTATGNTAATIGVTSDTAPTTTAISYQILPAATAAPSAATIVGAPTGTITTGSAGALTKAITALTTDTAVKAHFAQGTTSNVVSTASFTPPTLASSGTLAAQTGTASTAFTWAGATPESQITVQGVGSSAWTLTSAGGSGLTTINSSTGVPGGTLTATPGVYTVTVTKTDSSTAGTNPTGGGAPPQTIVRTISLTVSASGAATSVTLSGPSGGVVSVPSTTFAVGANGTITGTVIVTPSDSGGGGTFSPTSVSISAGTPTATFTYTPGTLGVKSISVTNNGGLANPSPISYTVTSGSGTYSLQIGPGYMMAGTNKIISTAGQWSAWQTGNVGTFGAPTLNGASTSDTNGIWTISGLPSTGTTRVLIKTTSGEFVGYWVGTAA